MESDTTSISFQPLSGAMSSTPFAYLLHIDEFIILLDCGWTEDFRLEDIRQLEEICSHVNAVLLSHASIEHIGALPYLCQHGLTAPIFATLPIRMLGSLLMFDMYLNKLDEEDFNLFKAADIDTAFQKINQMIYSQSEQLDGKNITITPYNSGNTLGGTVWKIVKGQNEVIYSVGVGDHSSYLSNFALEQGWHPTLWILDASGPQEHAGISEIAEGQFWRTMITKLSDDKIVLFPTDGISGSLEVVMMVVEYWKQYKIQFPIYFLTHSSTAIIKNTQSLSTYLSKTILERIFSENSSPFDFTEFNAKKVIFKCIRDMQELPITGPYVVIASSDTLQHGFSRKCFMNIGIRENFIVFTQREPKDTLGEQLRLDTTHRKIQILAKERVLLHGQELIEYKQMENAKQEKESINAEDAWKKFGDEDDDDDDNEASDEGGENPEMQAYQQTQTSIRDQFQFKHRDPLPVTDYGCEYGETYLHGGAPAAQVDQSKMIALNANEQNFIQEPDFPPSKFEEKTIEYPYIALATFFNKERASDFQTIAYNVTTCSPPDIIIIGAEKGPTMKLKEIINAKLINTRIQTPSIGEQVSLQRDFSTRKISLSRALLAGIDFKNCGINDVAYIEATLKTDEHQQFVQARPTEVATGHTATFVGTIDMPLLSSKLTNAGIINDFRNSVLECGQRRVKVRLNGDNGITIEGTVCKDYIIVRNVIQELLTMV